MVTGRRDCKTFSLAFNVHHLCVNLPACSFKYAVCLFLASRVFSSCTMVNGELELRGKPAALSEFAIPSGHFVVVFVFSV